MRNFLSGVLLGAGLALFFSTQHYSERIEQLDEVRMVAADECVEDFIETRVTDEDIFAAIDEVIVECVSDLTVAAY